MEREKLIIIVDNSIDDYRFYNFCWKLRNKKG